MFTCQRPSCLAQPESPDRGGGEVHRESVPVSHLLPLLADFECSAGKQERLAG